jgi:hypothetical protein
VEEYLALLEQVFSAPRFSQGWQLLEPGWRGRFLAVGGGPARL